MTEEKFQGYVELVKFNVEQYQYLLDKSKKRDAGLSGIFTSEPQETH